MEPERIESPTSPDPGSARRIPIWGWIAIAAAAAVLLGIVGIGVLATLVVPNVVQKLAVAQTDKAKVDITAIESALTEFATANGGRYPERLDALVTPDSNGQTYLEGSGIPRDPWGREYRYDAAGPDRPLPRVHTLGRDGAPGGEGADADLDNLALREDR